jgi:hypothetical protein
VVLALTACTSSSGTTDNTAAAASSEATQSSQGIDFILKNQPVPIFTSSAFRQELIEVEAIQALGSPTTSFFFPGAGMNGNPIKVCPSQGLPLPVDAQLSNPSQVVPDPYGGGYQLNKGGQIIPQMDPNGVYTGGGTGTYVLCDSANGTVHLAYWEGFVYSETGAAEWDKSEGQIVDIGPDQLPVCTAEVAARGDGSGVKPGTHYYHCVKAAHTTAYVTGGRAGLALTGIVRSPSGRYGWQVRDSSGRTFVAPVMNFPGK